MQQKVWPFFLLVQSIPLAHVQRQQTIHPENIQNVYNFNYSHLHTDENKVF